MEYLRHFAFEATEQEKDDLALVERVERENCFLRDLLQVSREPKLAEIEAALVREETNLDTSEYEKLIQGYRDQRYSRKSKSIGNVAKKSYLLDTTETITPTGAWDSFFSRGESKSKHSTFLRT